jgi:hypothetical protein
LLKVLNIILSSVITIRSINFQTLN